MPWSCLFSLSSEDVVMTNIFSQVIRLQKMSSRRHDQDECICLGHMSSRRLPKTSRRLQGMFKTFWGCLQNVLTMSCKDVFKTYHQVKLFLLTRLQDVFETYSTRFWDLLRKRYLHKDLLRSHFWEIYGHGAKFPKSELFNTKTFETVF